MGQCVSRGKQSRHTQACLHGKITICTGEDRHTVHSAVGVLLVEGAVLLMEGGALLVEGDGWLESVFCGGLLPVVGLVASDTCDTLGDDSVPLVSSDTNNLCKSMGILSVHV